MAVQWAGCLGGYIARAGNDVTLIDFSRLAIDPINEGGLSIEEKDGSLAKIAIAATDDPAQVDPVDLIVNFVKCYHIEAAIGSALPTLGP